MGQVCIQPHSCGYQLCLCGGTQALSMGQACICAGECSIAWRAFVLLLSLQRHTAGTTTTARQSRHISIAEEPPDPSQQTYQFPTRPAKRKSTAVAHTGEMATVPVTVPDSGTLYWCALAGASTHLPRTQQPTGHYQGLGARTRTYVTCPCSHVSQAG